MLLYTLGVNAQGTAPVSVSVMNMESKPYVHDKILFVGEKSKKIYSGTTDQRGTFLVQLPDNDTYTIKIDVIGDAMEYNTLEIPALPTGASFQQMELSIQYELPSYYTLSDLRFETGKSTIRTDSYEIMDQLVDFMRRKGNTRIVIVGHTDNIGDASSNLILSRQRADSVRAYLIRNKVDASRIKTEGRGSREPVADNSTESGRAQNRRTEVRIVE